MKDDISGTSQSSVKYTADAPAVAQRRCESTSSRTVKNPRRMTLPSRTEYACRNGERKSAHSGSP